MTQKWERVFNGFLAGEVIPASMRIGGWFNGANGWSWIEQSGGITAMDALDLGFTHYYSPFVPPPPEREELSGI